MPEAANSLGKRKRGGQPGNSNRLVHGRYTQKRAARRTELRAIRRKGRALVILVKNVLKARHALKHRRAAFALAAAPAPVLPRRPASLRRKNHAYRCGGEQTRAVHRREALRPVPRMDGNAAPA